MKRMMISGLCLVLLAIIPMHFAEAQTPRERIKISYPATAMSLLPLFVGAHLGPYEEEGLEAELVRMSGNLIPAALLKGGLDYTTSSDAPVISAQSGLPIRLLAAMEVKTPLSLVVRPEIKTVADLKGKAIGVSRAGTTTDYIAREIVRHFGLNPDRDITTLGLGDQSSRLISLQAGSVHGAILDAPNDVKAEAMGFKILAFSGDVLPDLLVGGLGTSVAKIQKERSQVKRVLRAFIKSQMMTVDKPDIIIPFVMRFWKIDRPTAEKGYNLVVRTFARDGTPTPESLAQAIKRGAQLTKSNRTLTPEDFFARDLLEEVQREMGLRK